MGQQVQQLVGAGAADDTVGIEPEGAADRFAQHARGAFRIIVKMGRGLPEASIAFGEGPNGVSLADSLNTLRPASGTGLLPGV